MRLLVAATAPEDDAGRERREAEARALGIGGDARLSPGERVEIHRAMYFLRLRDAIGEDFPAVRAALGEPAFAELVAGYAAARPPRDPSLVGAGAALPDHLATHLPQGAPEWLLDLARFEGALAAVFVEVDEPVLRAERLASLPPDRWPGLEIRPIAALRVLAPRHAVDEIRSHLLAGRPAEPSGLPDGSIRAWRQESRVFQRRIGPVEASCLEAARGGIPFATLCGHLAATAPGLDAAEHALGLLRVWLEDELIVDPGNA